MKINNFLTIIEKKDDNNYLKANLISKARSSPLTEDSFLKSKISFTGISGEVLFRELRLLNKSLDDSVLDDVIMALKDKTGNISKEMQTFAKEIVPSLNFWNGCNFDRFIYALKDVNGNIPKKLQTFAKELVPLKEEYDGFGFARILNTLKDDDGNISIELEPILQIIKGECPNENSINTDILYKLHKLFISSNEPEISKAITQTIDKKIKPNYLPKDVAFAFQKALIEIDGCIKDFKPENFKYGLRVDKYGKIELDNKQLENCLNSIFDAFPELKNMIGKNQHGIHAYTVDIHTLSVLKEFVASSEYQKLSKTDKKAAKLAILFHDLEKIEGEEDKTHWINSAMTANISLSKIGLTPYLKSRIIDMIKNHHWFEEYSTGTIKMYEDIAFLFKRPNDWEIAKAFARADLMSVNLDIEKAFTKTDLTSGQPESYSKLVTNFEKVTKEVEKLVNKVHSEGIFVPQTNIPNVSRLKDKIAPVKITCVEGTTENIVIKLNNVKDFESLNFAKGTNRDNFGVIIHCTWPSGLTKIESSCHSTDAEGFFSGSFVTLKDFNTYEGRRFGVILKVAQPNIIAMGKTNINSGTTKSNTEIMDFLFSNNLHRKAFSELIKKDLNLDDIEYVNLFKENCNLTSITDIQDQNLRQKIFEIIKKNLINPEKPNELAVAQPEVTGIFVKDIKSLNEIPYEFRKLAERKGIPILIWGD